MKDKKVCGSLVEKKAGLSRLAGLGSSSSRYWFSLPPPGACCQSSIIYERANECASPVEVVLVPISLAAR